MKLGTGNFKEVLTGLEFLPHLEEVASLVEQEIGVEKTMAVSPISNSGVSWKRYHEDVLQSQMRQ